MSFLIPLVLMFVVFYFMIIRPQNKERARISTMIQSLKKGDKIMLNSGIIGEVDMISDESDDFIFKSEGTKLKVKKQVIIKKIEDGNEN